MQKVMKILSWYNILYFSFFILLNVTYLLQGSEKFKVDILLMSVPALIFMIGFLRGQRIFMKILAWYTLLIGSWSLFIYIVYVQKSIFTVPVIISLIPPVIFSILYILSRRMDIEDQLVKIKSNMFNETIGLSKWKSYIGAEGMLKQCKEDALREGTIGLPINHGDVLLEKEHSDENVKLDLAKKRRCRR